MWLEIPGEGTDLHACQFVNHFRHLAAADVARNAVSLTGEPARPGEQIPRAARAARNVGPSAAEKEASLVIGHRKDMSGA